MQVGLPLESCDPMQPCYLCLHCLTVAVGLISANHSLADVAARRVNLYCGQPAEATLREPRLAEHTVRVD